MRYAFVLAALLDASAAWGQKAGRAARTASWSYDLRPARAAIAACHAPEGMSLAVGVDEDGRVVSLFAVTGPRPPDDVRACLLRALDLASFANRTGEMVTVRFDPAHPERRATGAGRWGLRRAVPRDGYERGINDPPAHPATGWRATVRVETE